MPESGDIRYEVFWFIQAVVIDGVIDPDESRYELQSFETLDEAFEQIKRILPSAEKRRVTVQKQKFDTDIGDWRDSGYPVQVLV